MQIFINQQEDRPRAGWRVLLQFIIMVVIMAVVGLVFYLVLPTSLPLMSAGPMFFAVIGSVWIAAKYFDKRPLADYGINFNRLWSSEFLLGAAIAALAQMVIFGIEWSAGWISITGYGWNAETEVAFWIGFPAFFLAMLLVGFHEELFSRGYQILNLTEGFSYPGIGQGAALTIAVLLTSSLFGFLHYYNPNASALSTFNIILAGVVLAIPFILTGRLALSAGLHFSWNFVMAGILGFPVSGQTIETSVLQIQQNGSELITGGAFGPEAGLIGLLGMAIMLGGACVYIKMAGYELTVDEIFTNKYQPPAKSDEQRL